MPLVLLESSQQLVALLSQWEQHGQPDILPIIQQGRVFRAGCIPGAIREPLFQSLEYHIDDF